MAQLAGLGEKFDMTIGSETFADGRFVRYPTLENPMLVVESSDDSADTRPGDLIFNPATGKYQVEVVNVLPVKTRLSHIELLALFTEDKRAHSAVVTYPFFGHIDPNYEIDCVVDLALVWSDAMVIFNSFLGHQKKKQDCMDMGIGFDEEGELDRWVENYVALKGHKSPLGMVKDYYYMLQKFAYLAISSTVLSSGDIFLSKEKVSLLGKRFNKDMMIYYGYTGQPEFSILDYIAKLMDAYAIRIMVEGSVTADSIVASYRGPMINYFTRLGSNAKLINLTY